MKIPQSSLRNIACILLMFASVQISSAQEYSYGVKAGLNYSLGNDGSEIAGILGTFNAKPDFGYLAGGFGEIRYNKFLVRPEIFFSYVASKFIIEDEPFRYNYKKINIPLLIGYNFYGPIEIYAGPSYQKIIDSRLVGVEEKIELEQKRFNGHFGLKFIYEKWEVDVRYEFSPSSKNNQIINIEDVMDDAYFDDGRLNNIMLTLNYKIFDSQTYSAKEVVDK